MRVFGLQNQRSVCLFLVDLFPGYPIYGITDGYNKITRNKHNMIYMRENAPIFNLR